MSPEYTSMGTIKMSLNVTDMVVTKIFFVPSRDYSVQHENKTFAVFVPSGRESVRLLDAYVVKYDPEDKRGIEVCIAKCDQAGNKNGRCVVDISAAKQCQVRVRIEAEDGGPKKIKLTCIDIPA